MTAAVQSTERILAEAARAGIDLDLVDSTLALSVAERWAQHDDALDLAEKLAAGKRRSDAESQPASPQTR